jgi:glycosyltransferase involved in cell wall biosynthesis
LRIALEKKYIFGKIIIMKICLIGPGIMSIPPENWGAVESLIWDQYEYLQGKGIQVDILNTKDLAKVADIVNNTDYDFVHLQYDDHAIELSKTIKKPFCTTTHYGYIKEHYPHYHGWKHIFEGVKRSPGIISLSPEIESLFRKSGYSGFSRVLRNGARFKDFKYKKCGNGNALCLGKVEPRKKQSHIANFCDGKCNIHFIGPVIDPNFRENSTCSYKGVWAKPDLYNNLTEYSSLILLSDGEAAPLVVPEALSAGLSLVLTDTAAANLDRSLPFIHVLPWHYKPEQAIETINKANAENKKYRSQIRDYAKNYFDWEVICNDYLDIVRDFAHENSILNNSN